jgi:hypothetical protein
MVRHGRDDEPTVVLKADKAAVEKVVDGRREQKTILAVQPLLIRRVAPRLAMAGDEMDRVLDPRDTAAFLDLADPFLEEPLPFPCPNDRFALSIWNCGIAGEVSF